MGVVLAGGSSSRLGRDKALLPWWGETLAQHAAGRLAAVCEEVAAADRGRGLLAGRRSLGDAAVPGPAGGILGAATAYPGRSLLVLACDLPLVPPALLSALAARATSGLPLTGGLPPIDWCAPRWEGRIEPLCALYTPRSLAALAALAADGTPAPHRLATSPGLAVSFLEEAALASFGVPRELFLNVNTAEDLARCRLLAGESGGEAG